MKMTVLKRTVDPMEFSSQVDFTTEDCEKAFDSQENPDEGLYYNIFGPGWKHLKISEQLHALSQMAALVEQPADQPPPATNLHLTGSVEDR